MRVSFENESDFFRVCVQQSPSGGKGKSSKMSVWKCPPRPAGGALTVLSKSVTFSAKKGVVGDVTPSPDQIRLSSPQSHHPLYAGGILRPGERGRVDVGAPSPPLFPHYEAI